jgi:DnaJ-class molecular chaperone
MTGTTNDSDENSASNPKQTGENTCPACRGTGVNSSGERCAECGGTGIVIETVGDA